MELQLLEKFKSSLASDLEKKEVEAAYLQRKDNLAKIPEKEDPGEPEPKKQSLKIPIDEYHKVIQSVHGDGLRYHTYQDIGRYTVFPEAQVKRLVPSVMYGRFREDEFSKNETYGIQTREEGLRITNDLSRLTLPKDRSVDYGQIARMTNGQAKEEILQDEVNFVAVYQDFCLSLIDYINSKEPYDTMMEYK